MNPKSISSRNPSSSANFRLRSTESDNDDDDTSPAVDLPFLDASCFAAPPAGGLHGDPSPDLAPPSVHDALPSPAVADDLTEEEVVATYFLDMILEVIAVELDDPEALAILHLMAQIAEAEEAPAEILSLGFSVIPVRQSRDLETWVPTLSAPSSSRSQLSAPSSSRSQLSAPSSSCAPLSAPSSTHVPHIGA